MNELKAQSNEQSGGEEWSDIDEEDDEFKVENTFYEAKYLLNDQPQEAFAKFKEVL